jgi:hypothetical protein
MSENPTNPAALYSRLQTATAIIRCVQSLIPAMDECPDRFQEYWDMNSASGPFTDGELVSIGITAAQLTDFINVIENYNKWCTAGEPVNNNYKANLNAARRLSA